MSSVDTASDGPSGGGRRKRKSHTTQIQDDDDSDGRDPSDLDGVEKQRETHNQIEKRRREKMNMYITELSDLVPKCMQTNKKMDKLTVLKLAVQHLRELRGNPSDEEQLHVKPQFLADDELKCLILEAADGFLFVVGCDDAKLVYVSDSIYHILKQSQHDWIGKEIFQVIHPRDIGRVEDQLLTKDTPPPAEASDSRTQARLAAGSRRSFFCRMRCGPTVNNRIEETSDDDLAEKLYYIIVHVTGYIKPWKMPSDTAAADDADSEKLCLVAIGRLQTTVAGHVETDSVPVAKEFMSRHALDGKFSFVDQRVMEVLGYMPQELVGSSMYEFYHRDDVPRLAEDHKAVLNGNLSDAVESTYRFRNKSGQWVWLKSKFLGFRNPWTQQLNYIIGHNFLVSRDGSAQLSLAPRHALPSPGTLSVGSVPESPLSTMTSSPGGSSLRERTPPVSVASPVVSSPLLQSSGSYSQRQSVIRQADFVPEAHSTLSYHTPGFGYGSSSSEMPSLPVVMPVSQGPAGGPAVYGAHTAANSQAGSSMRQPTSTHFQQPQLHPQHQPAQRRVTVGQMISRGSVQVNSQGQLQQLPQQTHMMTHTTYTQPASHSLQPPLPDFSQVQPSFSQVQPSFSQVQPSFSQSQFLSHPLYQPSVQAHSPFPWEEPDEAVSSIVSSLFRAPPPIDQQAPMLMGPPPGMPSVYQHT